MLRHSICAALISLLFVSWPALSGSLYLPLQLSPEFEARVERLFVIANIPIIKRPIPVKAVHQAIEHGKAIDPVLAASVEQYIERFAPRANITHVSATGSISNGAEVPLPNARGATTESDYQISATGYWTVNNFVAVNVGGLAFNGSSERDTFAEGSFISLGWDYFQADIGFRPRWWGPFQESDMLQSTNAAALPSITFSNVVPLPFWNTRYEVFLGRMSSSDGILSADNPPQRLSGNPLLFGTHLSIEPFPGMSIGFNRLLQFGGADRDQSLSGLADAFFNAAEADNIGNEGNDFGNQLSSVTVRYTFSGSFPISLYMQYAGEDTSQPSDFHLGNDALAFGIHLPKLTKHLDFTFETAEWQNGWYVNNNFGDGLTNFGSIVGHWGASFRIPGTDLGAQAHTAKLIWDSYNGQSLTLRFRQVSNNVEGESEFESANFATVEYARAIGQWIGGLTFSAGNDVFGDDFQQLSVFLRW